MQSQRSGLPRGLRRAPWWPYLIAALVTAATTAPLVLAQRHLNIFNVSLLYLVPVLLSATLGGLGPGIVAAVVALFAFDWYFLPPRYTVTVASPQDMVAFGVFLVAATLAGQLSAVARRRARNAALLHELCATLAASPQPVDTLPAVARRIAAIFDLPTCTLALHDPTAGPAPRQATPPGVASLIAAPVRRGSVGVSMLSLDVGSGRRWRADERQMLETLTNAAAVAIERAHLATEERAAAVVRESDRLKSALLSAVSHDLRTPLASIKATASGLLEDDVRYDAATMRQFLAGIDGEADRLMRLVSNLLDVSRIEAGSLHPNQDWYEPAELIGTALGTLAPILAGHRVKRVLAPDLPLVWCDYVHVQHVLANLLENAVYYAPAGTTITIAARCHEIEVVLTVADEGPGVPLEERGRVFNAFVRGAAAGAGGVGGTGLGLAICKGLIEANGGRIWINEAPCRGAVFAIALPCAAPAPCAMPGGSPADAMHEAAADLQHPGATSGAGARP